MVLAYITLFFLFLVRELQCHAAIYNVTSSRPLFPNETLVSPGQIFELGFFRANDSDDQYVGMWYTNMSPLKVVWVANREKPLPYTDRSASLTIGTDGNLKLVDWQGDSFWSTNISASSSDGSSAILLDSGNLVLRDSSSGNNLWESFDEPSDTLLQTMEMGINTITAQKRYLTSWKSNSDPSVGKFVTGITSDTPPQFFIWINGSIPYWRTGPWDKSRFTGIPSMAQTYLSSFTVQQNTLQGTTYFILEPYNSSTFLYLYISSNGSVKIMMTNDRVNGWILDYESPVNQCEVYGTCGPMGICNEFNSPICNCLEGFMPSSVEEWNRGNWTGGCTRETQLNCEKDAAATTSSTIKQDAFRKMSSVKLPDTSNFLSTISSIGDCQTWCLSNCSCLAYSYVDTIGCLIWTGKLMDIQQFSASGEDLYLRLADITTAGDSGRNKALIISLTFVSGIIILGAFYALYRCRSKQNDTSNDVPKGSARNEQLKSEDGRELPNFSFQRILAATNNFSGDNKLGQGGFGPVYKGKLQDRTEIAVKRLASCSGQGMEEFKTEILLISKLQHRNLVKLIGCCIEPDEKILVYEFLPNKSLDTFLFDPIKKAELSWDKRFQIIQGIAGGLLYLHRDSQLRIIHRDLKAGNILLDEKLNPKISDFGLARMFQGTQDLVNTGRVVGTLGYMAPEYAMGGIFSEKSDMYSFGVLLLEIVSSKKNTSFCNEGDHINLLSYTWELWREGRVVDLLDEAMVESSSLSEVEKCIQIGLMCVQDHAVDRPHMSSVVQMLSGETDLVPPKEPMFVFQVPSVSATPFGGVRIWSTNDVTNSIVEGR